MDCPLLAALVSKYTPTHIHRFGDSFHITLPGGRVMHWRYNYTRTAMAHIAG